jgi:SAM-dependent methyltransferase
MTTASKRRKLDCDMAPSKRSLDYFDNWDDSAFGEEQAIYRVVNLVSRGLVRGDVLDLGCGSRVYYDVSTVKRWVGLDPSSALLEQLRFLGPCTPAGPIEKLCSDCWDLPFADDEFDTVCAMFVLHHLAHTNRRQSEAEVLTVMREARRVLRKDGTLMVLETWPQPLLAPYHLLYPLLFPLVRRLTGVLLPYFLPPRRLRRLASAAGFSECHVLAVDLYEDIRQPVLNIVLPAWFQRLVQKYTIYVIKP